MLTPHLLYLLKANAVLLLFAAAYFGLLRPLTFFTLNRFYLLGALLFAAVYPVLPVPALLPAAAVAPLAVVLVDTAASVVGPTRPATPPIDWADLALVAYATGAMVLLGRLLLQLLALARLRRHSRPAVVNDLPVRALTGDVSPFSFGQTVYLNPARHPAPELAAVLRHEQVHVRQWHTLDVLLAQVVLALAWCNPAAWLLRRALLDNLEYLADHAVLQTGLDRQAYQYSLLRLSHGAAGPALVSHFTFLTLKNRVAMMNRPLSSTGQLARYFVAGPLVLAVALGFSAARAQGAGPVAPVRAAQPAAPVSAPRKAAAAAAPAVVAAATAPSSVVKAASPKRALALPAATQQAAAAPAEEVSTPAIFAPWPSTPPIYYMDGQLYRGDINTINPSTIATIHVLKGDQARQAFGTDGAILITTVQNQGQPAVRAFNEKFAPTISARATDSAPAVLALDQRAGVNAPAAAEPAAATAQPTRVAWLTPVALAYITKTYPGARMLGVRLVPAADGGEARHQADMVLGRRPVYLLFDAQGQFISESTSSYAR